MKDHRKTVLIIEHNIEFIATMADYLIDLGIDSGNSGGNILIQGDPLEVVRNVKSSWNDLIQNLSRHALTT